MSRIKVAVSPFYGGESWTDELTKITFEKNPRGLNVYSIPQNVDLKNIRKAIRLNALILVEGNIGDFNEVEEITVPEVKAKEDVKVEIKEEPKAEQVEQVEEVQKKAPAKKAPVKKTTTAKTSKK